MAAPVNVDPDANEKLRIGHILDERDVEKHALSLRGRTLTASLAFVAGTGFTLFGYAFPIERVRVLLELIRWNSTLYIHRYDQGVMSALLTTGQVRSRGSFRFEPLLTRARYRSSKRSSPRWSWTRVIPIMRRYRVLWSPSMYVGVCWWRLHFSTLTSSTSRKSGV